MLQHMRLYIKICPQKQSYPQVVLQQTFYVFVVLHSPRTPQDPMLDSHRLFSIFFNQPVLVKSTLDLGGAGGMVGNNIWTNVFLHTLLVVCFCGHIFMFNRTKFISCCHKDVNTCATNATRSTWCIPWKTCGSRAADVWKTSLILWRTASL